MQDCFWAFLAGFGVIEGGAKYIGKNGSDCMLFFTWVIKLMKFIGKNVVLCTCLILGEIHALSRPQQAGYAASSLPLWLCLGLSSGVTRPCRPILGPFLWPVVDVSCPFGCVWGYFGPNSRPSCSKLRLSKASFRD